MINLTQQQVQRAIKFTTQITTRWNDRLAGSEACLATGLAIESELKKFCDSTETQEFAIYPKSFLGFIRLNIVIYFCILFALYFQQFSLASILSVTVIIITVFQFLLYFELTDKFYPKKTARNIIGRIEPTGKVKQQIIISAHHDSANVFNILQFYPKYYGLIVNSGLGILFALVIFSLGLSIAQLLGYQTTSLLSIGLMAFGILSFGVIPLWFFHRPNQGTPGAGDNLICTAVSLEIGRYFADLKQQGKGLQHTRLLIGSWDAEEVGLRGARAFLKENKAAFLQTKTYNYNLECLYDRNAMGMLTSDLNSFVKLSESMAQECSKIGQKLGYNVSPVPFPLLAGGTDAAEFAKVGIEATTFHAMSFVDKGELPAYHTLRDTVDAVDEVAVAAAIEIGLAYVENKEAAIAF